MTAQVAIFVPCFVPLLNPQTPANIGRILDRLGISWQIPKNQTCCGQPSFNAGLEQQTAQAAARWIRLFADSEVVIAPSASCIGMVRQYENLRSLEPSLREAARALAKRSFEFSQYLVDQRGIVDVGAQFDGVLAYHDGCHALRHLKIWEQPRQLLSHVQGLTLRELEGSPECCGFGGTFSVKYPELSVDMADDKLARFAATAAQGLVSTEPSCLMHLEARARRQGLAFQAWHIADVLAEPVDTHRARAEVET